MAWRCSSGGCFRRCPFLLPVPPPACRSPPPNWPNSVNLGRRLRSNQPSLAAMFCSANSWNSAANDGPAGSSLAPAKSMLLSSTTFRSRSCWRRLPSASMVTSSSPSDLTSRVCGIPFGQQPARLHSAGICWSPTRSKSSSPGFSMWRATAWGSSLRHGSEMAVSLRRRQAPTTAIPREANSRIVLRFVSRSLRAGGRSTSSSRPRVSSSNLATCASTVSLSSVSLVRIQLTSNSRKSSDLRERRATDRAPPGNRLHDGAAAVQGPSASCC